MHAKPWVWFILALNLYGLALRTRLIGFLEIHAPRFSAAILALFAFVQISVSLIPKIARMNDLWDAIAFHLIFFLSGIWNLWSARQIWMENAEMEKINAIPRPAAHDAGMTSSSRT